MTDGEKSGYFGTRNLFAWHIRGITRRHKAAGEWAAYDYAADRRKAESLAATREGLKRWLPGWPQIDRALVAEMVIEGYGEGCIPIQFIREAWRDQHA